MLHVDRLATPEPDATRTHAREHVLPPHRSSATVASTAHGRERASVRLAMGQQLGERYRVIGFLGKGGMGSVYRVYDRVLGEDVALKFVRGDHEHLRAEVRLAQQVTHHNVCRTYDLEAIDGQHYVKMEYISGETLAAHLGQMSIATTLDILRAVTDGLAAAHARGIVHRDLKPGNVMLNGERVVIVDFGLAQFEGESDLAGTPAYMSPEQLVGGAVDARSDLFALGCLAFAMLTGAPPYGEGTLAEVAAQQVTAPRRDVRSRRSDVPRWLATAISTLLSPDPTRRARGVRLLRSRRQPWRLAFPILAVGLLATGAAMALRQPPVAAPWHPAIVDLPQYDENADDPSWSPDGKVVLFSSDRGHRDQWAVYVEANDGADPRQISPPDRFCLGARWTRDGTAALMSCFVGSERRILRQPISGGPPSDLGPGWAVDDCGDAVAVVVTRAAGAELVLRDAQGVDRDVIAMPRVANPRCDRRGQQIAYVEGEIGNNAGFTGALAVVDRHGQVRRLANAHTVNSLTFTPDGSSIVFSADRGSKTSLFEIAIADAAVHELTPNEEYATAPDLSSDGRALLFDRDRTSIPLFELSPHGAIQRTFRFEQLWHAVATPDDRALVAARQAEPGSTMVAIDLGDFSERELGPGEPLYVGSGGELVFRSSSDPSRLLAATLAGGPVSTVAVLPAPILDAVEGPDGRHLELGRDGTGEAWLVGSDGRATPEGVRGLVIPAPAGGWRVVRVTDGNKVTLQLVPPGRSLTAPAYERRGWFGQPVWIGNRELAYCDHDACHRIDVATGRELVSTPIEIPGNHPITISKDGKRWFITSNLGHVTRHVITNFADRSWAR